jgi:vacuolar-type H+-ATPase subunit I/STV1
METNTSLNILSYLIYISLTTVITFIVGNSLHKTGKVFLSHLFTKELDVMLTVNNILLIGYYLLNIGFALYTMNNWDKITTVSQLIQDTGYHISIILMTLGIIHYFNITALLITAKIKNKTSNLNT